MKKLSAIISLLLITASVNITFAQTPSGVLLGFTPQSSVAEREVEQKFDANLSKQDLDTWLKRLSLHPHAIGSAYGKQNAEYIAEQFRSWGYDTQIESFDVLFPTPKFRLVEMTRPSKYVLKLSEPPVAGDPSTLQQKEQLPTYNAYSIDGDATGPLVYVNYGTPADYDELDRRGISVRGKVVIARYGGAWRGIKPKVAAEHGALACIIYSGPKNDGYYQGDVYPKGPFRNENGVQRGSVMDMPIHPGDPLTPGVGATKGAKRIDRKDVDVFTKIPVLPISYGDALPLLKQLDGANVPDSWRGGLPITYKFGGTTPTVHVKLQFNWNVVPIYNVIAKLRGAAEPDQWIIRGNHHDAWVNGAQDPLSGLISLMDEARSIGLLAKQGMKPKRTIVYCAWDGEEEGLLGSTEWVETHADELKQKAAVYINSDTNARGFIGMGGTHSLESFINDVARDVTDPQTKVSVWQRSRARQLADADTRSRAAISSRRDMPIGALGSGSDYTPFLQHLGIAALDLGFGGEGNGGSYHSIYDSYKHYTTFIDPGYDYGIALSQVAGRATLRLANADRLPFEFSPSAETIGGYVNEISRQIDIMRAETIDNNRYVSNGVFAAARDPRAGIALPQRLEDVPQIDLSPLDDAVKELKDKAADFDKAAAGKQLSTEKLARVNAILLQAERSLTLETGLPGRDWFKHQIYAPGLYTGYGVKTIPGVREAIEQRNWTQAREQIQIAARIIRNYSAEIERAAKIY